VLGLSHQVFSIPLEAVVGGIGGIDKRARNYALITMGWSAANFLGPLVAGFSIDHIGHLRVFLLLAAVTFIPIAILGLKRDFLTEMAKRGDKDKRGSVLELWRMPYLRTTFITSGIIGSAQDLFQFYLPIYGHALNLSASAIGTILGMVALAAFVMRAIIPFLMKKLNEVQMLTFAIFVAAFAYMLLPFFANAYALAAIAFLLGLGVGSAQPMSMSLLYVLTPAGRIAESIGLNKTVRNATQIVIPIFFGSVGTAFGFTTVFLSNSAVLVSGGVLLRKIRVPDHALRRMKSAK
jgi:predicted MFS family arabinose efflux permease